MNVGLYHLRGVNGDVFPAIRAYEAILDFNGIKTRPICIHGERFWDELRRLTAVVVRFQHVDNHLQEVRDFFPLIAQTVDVPTFPDPLAVWLFDDKVRQTLLFEAKGYPIARTRVFYDRDSAKAWFRKASWPLVFKLKGGAGSTNVVLVRNGIEGADLVNAAFGPGIHSGRIPSPRSLHRKFRNHYQKIHRLAGDLYRRSKGLDPNPHWRPQKNVVLFQQYLPNNAFDTRVTTIGKRAFAFRRRTRTDDFRASGSGNIDYDPNQIDPRCIEVAFRVSGELGFKSMAYDFLFDENNSPVICEASYAFVSKAVYGCQGYWDAEHNWHPGHFWPEALQLADLLNVPTLKCPAELYGHASR